MRRSVCGLVFGSLILMAGCSGSSNAVIGNGSHVGALTAQVAPLTPDETQRLKATVASLGNVLGLAQSYATRPGAAPHAMIVKLFDQIAQDPALQKAVDESDCQKTIHYPDEHEPLKSGDSVKLDIFSVDVDGPGCAVSYHAGVTGVQKKDAFDATLTYKYTAHSKEALAANDVDATDLVLKMSANTTQTPDGTMNVGLTIDMGGQSHSQKEGPFTLGDKADMKISISFGQAPAQPGQPAQPQPGFSMSINGDVAETTTVALKSIAAELKSHVTMLGQGSKEEYSINGKPVTKEEYAAIHDSLKLPSTDANQDQGGGAQPMPGPGGGGAQPATVLSCQVEAFDAAKYPATDAQKSIGAHTPAPVPALMTMNACADGTKQTKSAMVNGMPFEVTFDFTSPSFARIDVGSGARRPVAVQRYFLPQQSSAYADADPNGFTIVTSCEAKPACAP